MTRAYRFLRHSKEFSQPTMLCRETSTANTRIIMIRVLYRILSCQLKHICCLDAQPLNSTQVFDNRNAFIATVNSTPPVPLSHFSCFGVSLYAKLRQQIIQGRLRQTTIIVLTQHPGNDPLSDLLNLRQIAIAFSVQVCKYLY